MRLGRHIKELLSKQRAETGRSFAILFSKFQSILSANNKAMELIADMGDKLGGDYIFDRQYIFSVVKQINELVSKLIIDINALSAQKYGELFKVFERISYDIQQELDGKPALPKADSVISYDMIGNDFDEIVGAKIARLVEIRKVLGISIPDGFAITATGFDSFFRSNSLYDIIQETLINSDNADDSLYETASQHIQNKILSGQISSEMMRKMNHALEALRQSQRSKKLMLAVRSSAWGEDSEHSFAGQYQTKLNIQPEQLSEAYKEVLAGAYSVSALAYRRQKGFSNSELIMSVACQAMVDVNASGVVYTLDPWSPESETVLATVTWGLCAPLVEGEVDADRYVLSRTSPHEVKSMKIVHKKNMRVAKRKTGTEWRPVPEDLRDGPCLNHEQLKKLAEICLTIERYFKRPQDIEWALDNSGQFVILQTRALNITPQTAISLKDIATSVSTHPILIENRGVVVQRGVSSGRVFTVEKDEDLKDVPHGSIIVVRQTSPRLARVMQRICGIITDIGSPTGHMATIAREFRIPTIVNTKIATKILKTDDEITLDATQNIIYSGKIKELCHYELTQENIFEESYEYRLLRRIIKKISPLNLINPYDKNFIPSECKTFHDIIRFIHEMAVDELIQVEHAGNFNPMQKIRHLKFDIPLGLTVIDIEEDRSDSGNETTITPEEVESLPMLAFLNGLMEPGMWNTQALNIDFGSFMSSLTRTFSSSLATPKYVGRNLAVISRHYLHLSLRLGYHFNLIDAYISENLNDNYAYFRFLGGVTDIERRSRRAKFIAEVLERSSFRVEVKGDLIVGRIKKLEKLDMEEKMWLLGCLVSYTRQLDIQMKSDGLLNWYIDDFFRQIS